MAPGAVRTERLASEAFVPDEAVAAVLTLDPEGDTVERLVAAGRLGPFVRPGIDVPASVLDRARRAQEDLAERGRLCGGPTDLGVLYEALLGPDSRRAGAHYTPPAVARALTEAALTDAELDATEATVWDPACGGGVFLLAAADLLTERGGDPRTLLTERLQGTDVDPGAGFVTAASLHLWGLQHGVDAEPTGLRCGDSLLDDAAVPARPVQLVIGNPPFHGQLSGANVRGARRLEALRARFGDLVGTYTDTAAIFLAVAVQHLALGGRCALVQPLSVLAARDTTAIRRWTEERASLIGLWVAGEPVFDAAVEVCAPILRRHGPDDGRPPSEDGDRHVDANGAHGRRPFRRWRGRGVQPIVDPALDEAHCDVDTSLDRPVEDPPAALRTRVTETVSAEHRWSAAALPALGVPDPRFRSDGHLGDLVRALAGFRDEYYGLVPHVLEGPEDVEPEDPTWPSRLAPLMTVGLIDPGMDRWGDRSVTFARRRLRRPVVDLDSVLVAGGAAASWIRATRVPKVLVATQTRVGEATVDRIGHRVASTPTIAVLAPVERLWEVAAVICSPFGSVAAIACTAGTGRTATSIRHRTASIIRLPLPVDHEAWRSGALALADGDRDAFVEAMAAAHDVPAIDATALSDWWFTNAP